MIVDKARAGGKPVALCGELASKPIGALALIGARLPRDVADAVGARRGQGDAARSRCRARPRRCCARWSRTRRRTAPSATSSRPSPPPKGCNCDDAAGGQARHAAHPPRRWWRPSCRARLPPETVRQAVARVRRDRPGGGQDQGLSRGRGRDRRPRGADRRSQDRSRDARDGRRRAARRSTTSASGSSRSCGSRCCPRTRWTSATSSSKSAPAPAATRPRCSPATCSACTSATPRGRAGPPRSSRATEGTKGGFKEIVAEIKGRGPFARLKFESGVHRVQRVPDTEAQGRIHTSAATVAVLPEVEDVDIEIKPDDLKIDTMRSQGAGGQHVNKTESAIRITHMPSGIVVMVQEERSQHKNRAKAMAMLRAKLYDAEKTRIDKAARRRAQGSGRLRRPLRAHPHLQFSARPRHRPPHQPDALQPAQGDGGRGAGRDHRRADHRASGRTAGGREAHDAAACRMRAAPT